MKRYLLLLPLSLLALAAPVESAVADCLNQHTVPRFTGDEQAQVAALCLVNADRAAAGARPLRMNPQLEREADDYAQRLVNQQFFSHIDPLGGTLYQRTRASNYLLGADLWLIGENIGWGVSTVGTPVHIVESWMSSPGHRKNMLNPSFRDIGIGLTPGTPAGGANGATHVQVYAAHTDAKKKPAKNPVKKPKPKHHGSAKK
ncbi:MAG: CAP domain-containing protein [Actinomycetes bacterium]